jgi:hypothetical protein
MNSLTSHDRASIFGYTTNQRGYAFANWFIKLESLKGTLADPKSVLVSAVFAAAGKLSHAISGCWPPRVLVKPILEILLVSACRRVSHNNIENLLMVDRPNAIVPDQQTVAAQVWRRSGIEIAVGRSCSANNARSSRLRREPHNSALPIVTMSQASRRRILWHVPSVHYSKSAIVCAAASVDLPAATATSIGWAT